MQRLSRLFWPVVVTPKNAVIKSVEATSLSQRLMTELGLVKAASNGTFQIMPLAQRALDKCIVLVERAMKNVDGQKVTLPVLTPTPLWKKSGRLNGDIAEFFILRDRHHKEFLLSPTHEEVVTAMLASAAPISYRQLPLRIYQIGPKFRDELKTRFGIIRAKEFLMKDMYTFDRTAKEAKDTYEALNCEYTSLFRKLEVPFKKVVASAGIMGGSMSHEYHYIAATGEDRLLHCARCGYASNVEVSNEHLNSCPHCECGELVQVRGLEVAHTFLLGDRYSREFGATYLHEDGKPRTLMMGCFGIGISRILAAALEVSSSETQLCWPTLLAPFDVCIIGPKEGSKEQVVGDALEQQLCRELSHICGAEEVLHDDRKHLTIGKRLMEAKRMGYPLVVVVGAGAMQATPKLELHLRDKRMDLELNGVFAEVAKHKQHKLALSGK